jgi:hypothetical protein
MIPGKPGGFWSHEERDALIRANGGMISLELMDTLKTIYLTRMIEALRPYQDSSGLPRHIPMPVDVNGDGPAETSDEDKMVCWCKDPKCWLLMGLRHQEVITMRWAAEHMDSMGYTGLAHSIRADAQELAYEYGIEKET